MLRFLADENFNGRILRALQRRLPDIEVQRVQDTELQGAPDAAVLARAAEEDRIVLTHDTATLVGYAHERVEAALPMPGVIAVTTNASIGRVVEDLTLVCQAGTPHELEDRVLFLPF